jgi:hypothetical protein
MVAQMRQMTDNDTMRRALDWTVFCVGALSLSIAITATVITHTAELRSDNGPPTELTTG